MCACNFPSPSHWSGWAAKSSHLRFVILSRKTFENIVNSKVEPTHPTVPAVPSGPAPAPKPMDDSTEKLFREIAGEDMEVDWMELKRILDHSMRDGSCSNQTNSYWKPVFEIDSRNICRLEFAPQTIGINNVNAVNANGDYSGGGGGGEADPGSGGILAAICAAFCKDSPMGQQLGLNQTNASPSDVPITSQSKCHSCTTKWRSTLAWNRVYKLTRS